MSVNISMVWTPSGCGVDSPKLVAVTCRGNRRLVTPLEHSPLIRIHLHWNRCHLQPLKGEQKGR